jgi:hypothetical protein
MLADDVAARSAARVALSIAASRRRDSSSCRAGRAAAKCLRMARSRTGWSRLNAARPSTVGTALAVRRPSGDLASRPAALDEAADDAGRGALGQAQPVG